MAQRRITIRFQNPNATHIARYSAWKYNFNRQVNKGEKGLVILAPFPAKETRMIDKLDVNGKMVLDSNGQRVQEEKEFDKLEYCNIFPKAKRINIK